MTEDTEKAEVLDVFFTMVFTSKTGSPMSLGPKGKFRARKLYPCRRREVKNI